MAEGLGEFFWGGTTAGKLFAQLVVDVDGCECPITNDMAH